MIDLNALWKAFQGDQTKKVSVNKEWLREVHSELTQLQRYRDEAAQASAMNDKLERGFSKIDKGMDKIFGKNGGFRDIFGKGRYR
jgi:hypothetical protein